MIEKLEEDLQTKEEELTETKKLIPKRPEEEYIKDLEDNAEKIE